MSMSEENKRAFKTEDGNRPDEPRIAKELVSQYQMNTCNAKSYNVDGEIATAELEGSAADFLIELGFKTSVAKKTKDVVILAKMLSVIDGIPLAKNEIPVKNGTICVAANGSISFDEEKHLSPYRLNCNYDPEAKDVTSFQRWLDDLFIAEDQICFQEILGYLLLPTTRGQKAFFLLGTGGEGKSIWGTILFAMFGNGFTPTKVHELEDNRFTVATVENRLVAYDDDLDGSKLKKTDVFKTVVSAKVPVQGERKGTDKFQFLPYARICACGNFALSALHDTSDGFFRRLLPIRVKNRPPERKDVSDFEQLLLPEMDAIFMWSLEGLKRLIKNDYAFSISDRSRELLSDIKDESDSMGNFLEKEVVFEAKARASSKALLAAYKYYCHKSGEVFRGGEYGLSSYLKAREENLGIRYDKRAVGKDRGFVGMRLKTPGINLEAILGKEGERR